MGEQDRNQCFWNIIFFFFRVFLEVLLYLSYLVFPRLKHIERFTNLRVILAQGWNIILEVTPHHSCYVIFLRRESLGPAQTRGEGTTQRHEYQEVGITGGISEAKNQEEKDGSHNFKSGQKERAFYRRGTQMSFKNLQKNSQCHQFSGGPVVRTRCFHCHGLGSFPGQGTEIPQGTWQGQKKNFSA